MSPKTRMAQGGARASTRASERAIIDALCAYCKCCALSPKTLNSCDLWAQRSLSVPSFVVGVFAGMAKHQHGARARAQGEAQGRGARARRKGEAQGRGRKARRKGDAQERGVLNNIHVRFVSLTARVCAGLTAGAFFGWARLVRPACLQTPPQERFLRSLDEERSLAKQCWICRRPLVLMSRSMVFHSFE